MLPLHHDLNMVRCLRFKWSEFNIVPSPRCQSSPGRSRTSHRRLIRSPCSPLQHRTMFKSGRWDSNPRSRAPEARGLAAALHPEFVLSVRTAGFEPAVSWPPTRRDNQASLRSASSTPYGSRTRIAGVKNQHPEPLDERGVSGCARSPSASGPGGARILVCGASNRR